MGELGLARGILHGEDTVLPIQGLALRLDAHTGEQHSRRKPCFWTSASRPNRRIAHDIVLFEDDGWLMP
jgi:hypothetical protein